MADLNAGIILQGRDANAIQAGAQQVARNAFALDQARQQAPMQNALLAEQVQGARMGNQAQEDQFIGQLLDSVARSPDPARAYGAAVQRAQQAGVQIPEGLEQYDPDAFQIIHSLYKMPPAERTDFQRKLDIISQTHGPEGVQQFVQNNLIGGQQKPFTLSPGQTRFDAQGRKVAQAPGGGSGLSITTADGTTIRQGDFGGDQGGVGPLAGGQDNDLRAKKRSQEMGKLDAKLSEQRRKITNGLDALERRDQIVLNAVADAKRKIKESYMNTGLVGQVFRGVGGTPALDLDKTMDAIRSNLSFSELQNMRDNSPTGGALGNVTERELTLLQSVQGSLDTARSEEDLLKTLDVIEQSVAAANQERRAAFERDFGDVRRGGEMQSGAPDLTNMSLDELRALEAELSQ